MHDTRVLENRHAERLFVIQFIMLMNHSKVAACI